MEKKNIELGQLGLTQKQADKILRQEGFNELPSQKRQGFFKMFVGVLMEPMLLNGSFLGEIKASINKKDMDIGITLYEVMPNGEYFHLSYFIGRAIYTHDITQRKSIVNSSKYK